MCKQKNTSVSTFSLIRQGFIVPIIGYSVQTNLSLIGVRLVEGDYSLVDLSGRVRGSDFDRTIVRAWQEKAMDRKSICFAVSIKQIDSLVTSFNAAGAKAVGIHGKLSVEELRSILKDFSEDKYNVLVVKYMQPLMGLDEPSINCVLMARPTTSGTLYRQMIGCGLRLNPGKKDCLVIDFVYYEADKRETDNQKMTRHRINDEITDTLI